MARGLLPKTPIMQIPYDLEFVSNRPTAGVRAVALGERFPVARGAKRREPDAGDAFLRWLHGLLSRLERR